MSAKANSGHRQPQVDDVIRPGDERQWHTQTERWLAFNIRAVGSKTVAICSSPEIHCNRDR
jgi:hypothetical protein